VDGSTGLDELTNTFTTDRSFCDTLAATPAAWHVAKLLIYAQWVQKYLSPIQEELCGMIEQRFSSQWHELTKFWTLALMAGVYKDVCLVPYFVVHGLSSEAGFAVRRSLEHVGVLTHLWQHPENAAYLDDGPEASGFRSAFVIEPNKQKAEELKQKGIGKRFAQCLFGKAITTLYSLFSSSTVHGGSPKQLVMSQLKPTGFSCGLTNRPNPQEIGKEIQLLSQACEILCTEIVFVHGTFGKLYKVTPSIGGEGGFFLTCLLNGAEKPESEMSKLIRTTLGNLRWAPDRWH
jgi:hypothetical protein